MANTTESVISVTEHFHFINLKLTESRAAANIINRKKRKEKEKKRKRAGGEERNKKIKKSDNERLFCVI